MNTEKDYNKMLKKLAKNIRKARLDKNLRQADMIAFGFSERYIQKIESGNYSPNLFTVHRLAEALEINIKEFFT